MAKMNKKNPLISKWTPMHLLSGVIMQKKGLTVGQAFAASMVFEVAENAVAPKLGIKAIEGANNMTMDVVLNMAGYYLGAKI